MQRALLLLLMPQRLDLHGAKKAEAAKGIVKEAGGFCPRPLPVGEPMICGLMRLLSNSPHLEAESRGSGNTPLARASFQEWANIQQRAA
jgi:hypothetical protein